MIFAISWIVLCFIVAMAGKNKKIGYWGAFILSILFSPLIGLMIALASGEKPKPPPPVSWKCGSCGFLVLNLAGSCSNCNTSMNYPDSAYNHIRYTCTNKKCKKKFFGRKESCPHCNTKNNW